MKIAIRKELNGSIYIDKEICQRMAINEKGEEIRLFDDETLSEAPYNYSFVEVDDEYINVNASDFNEDLTFNVEKYNERKQENSKEELRIKRQPLLIAFDKYKSNVNYGVEFETAEQRDEIVSWYNSILNLEGTAFEIIPERIRYYL